MRNQFIFILTQFAFIGNCAILNNNIIDIPENISNNNTNGIKYLTELLETSLNKTVVEYNLTDFSTPDPHFGGTLQLVNVKVATENDSVEDEFSSFVLKTSLRNADRRGRLENLKECRFYTDIAPALKAFEESANIPVVDRVNVLPQSFGCRLSLDSNAEVADSDYALLLENLKIKNYKNVESFTTDEIFAILKEMAKFHASFIAMRRLQPNIFDTHVKQFLMTALFVPNIDEVIETIGEELDLVPNLSTKTRAAVKEYLRPGAHYRNESFRPTETPYLTISHMDLYHRNIMINRADANEENLIKVKFIDFQRNVYRTFSYDLIKLILFYHRGNEYFIDLVKFYHAEFFKTIERLKCPSDDYTFDKFWAEIHSNAKFQLFDMLFIMKGAYTFQNRSQESIFLVWKKIIDFFDEFGLLDK